MKLAPRYCRTCGSRILLRNICHNCGCNPLEGNNYCYDCGSLTPKEVMCSNCGTTFKRKTSATTILLGSILVIAIAAACFFLYQNSEDAQKPNQEVTSNIKNEEVKNNPERKSEIKNSPDLNTNAVAIHPDSEITKTSTVTDSALAKAAIKIDSSQVKKINAGIISENDLKSYGVKCSYFEKKQKNAVIFFTANTFGYIKINDKIYQLKRTHKTSDIANFSGDEYSAVITIDGLSGSDKEWLAAATLTIKDVAQKTSAKYKVYSSCIDL